MKHQALKSIVEPRKTANFKVAIKGNGKKGNKTYGEEEAEPAEEVVLLCGAWRANLKVRVENKRLQI